MAQVAIPLVIVGALYLMSNDKNKDKENFEDTPVDAPYQLLKDNTTNFYNKIADSKIAMNNQGDYSQYQDKYYLGKKRNESTGDEIRDLNNNQVKINDVASMAEYEFFLSNKKRIEKAELDKKKAEINGDYLSLTGDKVSAENMTHNNMAMFYNSKSYGHYTPDSQRMDNYTGAGSLSIDKREISALFKPEQNVQNVYGNQNQSEFFLSRVNESLRKANTTPWEKVRDNKGELGFNWSAADRDKTLPKEVDELRATNNPKSSYANNYTAPAYDPKQVTSDQNLMGKFVKKGPETFHTNTMGQGVGGPSGMDKPMSTPVQMLTKEQRETTNVEYYGLMSSESMGYTEKGNINVHRQQLATDSVLNMVPQGANPTTAQNYGKDSYKSFTNNRDNNEDYYGNVRGVFLANVVDPIVKTLKHTKKTNKENTKNGYLKGCVKPMVFNPREMLSATNREMDVEKIGQNHLTMERQQSTGYLTSNPYLEDTQRQTTSNEVYGNAIGMAKTKSYSAEYNQRNIQKPIENRIPNGNAKKYNTESNYSLNKKEQTNDYIPYATRVSQVPDNRMLGETTCIPSQYYNVNDDYRSADLLKAFKSNPYTQPLHSVA